MKQKEWSKKKTVVSGFFVLCFLIISMLQFVENVYASTGLNVDYHTQDEIKAYIAQSGAGVDDALTFETEPQTEAPFAPGKLSEETLQSSIKMLNQIRYIAGIPYNVTIDGSYTELAQAAALANYANHKLSHSPQKPSGMDDALYELASEGAGSSNIAWTSWPGSSMNYSSLEQWMCDGDFGNIDCVGHRRWMLHPAMEKTGFGAVSGSKGTYSAVYAFDNSFGDTDYTGVAWPAQNMPVEYFDVCCPWSISLGTEVSIDDVSVKLVRRADGATWNFSSSSADGFFNVENSYYGQQGCIIFRPDFSTDSGYEHDDIYDVTITGAPSGEISYSVHFFELVHKHNYKNIAVTKEATCYETGEETHTCPCGDSYVEKIEKIPHSETVDKAVEPTCTSKGKTKGSHCSVCNVVITEQTEIPKKSHIYVETTTQKAAVKKEGKIQKKCTLCGEEKITTIPAVETVKLKNTSYTYNGKARKPSVVVKDSTEKMLESGKDYTVSYSKGRKNVGKYTVKIKFKGKYNGTVEKTFTIKPKSTSVSDITAKKKGFKVTWKKQSKQVTGYQIQYSTDSKFKSKSVRTITIKKYETTSKSVSKLKAKKKYYVRIRTYKTVKINGKNTKLYSAWSKAKKVTTKK